MDYFLLLNPIFSFSINVCFQLILYRSFKKIGVLKIEIMGFNAGLLILSVLHCYIIYLIDISLYDFIGISIANLLIYAGLSYCYFHFVNLSITARRIRLMLDLYNSNDGLSEVEILKRYNSKNMLDMRLSRLLSTGQIKLMNDRFIIGKPIILIISKIIIFLKSLLLGKKSVDIIEL